MFGLNKTIYTGIFVVAASASLLQMGLLGNGIVETVAVSPAVTPSPSVLPTITPATTPAYTKGFRPEHITISSVGIDLPVVSVPLENGTWEVNENVANFAEGTSYINKDGGNVGVFAHDRIKGFTRIKSLLTGSDIVLYNNNQKATYRVVSSSVIKPTDVKVFEPTEEPTLTLITCAGLFNEKRYMVKAELVKIENVK